MKNLNSIFVVVLIALLIQSCASVRGGANFGSDRYKYNSSSSRSPEIKEKAAQVSNTTTSSETGFYVGVFFTDIAITDELELQPEVNFVGIKDLNQIQAPVLAKYNVSESFNILAGPNFGFLLDTADGIKSFNMAIDFGISYDISEDFLIEARYDYGLTNLLENGSSDNSIKLSNFQVGVGYRF